MRELGRFLMVAGVLVFAAGAAIAFLGRAPIGRLPGDFIVRRGSFTLYFPLMTSIVISVVLSLLLWLFRR